MKLFFDVFATVYFK